MTDIAATMPSSVIVISKLQLNNPPKSLHNSNISYRSSVAVHDLFFSHA